jgi:allantoin racemase
MAQMRLHVINPNSTQSMTDKIGACARSVASPGTEIVCTNPASTPASIEGQYDEAMSIPGLLAEVKTGEQAGSDGFVIACFDDVGLGACREIATGPVLGICEAAMHAASMIATGFSVVTTLHRAVPLIEDLALRYGMDRRCRRVRAADIPVLALEELGSNARQKVLAEITRAGRPDRLADQGERRAGDRWCRRGGQDGGGPGRRRPIHQQSRRLRLAPGEIAALQKDPARPIRPSSAPINRRSWSTRPGGHSASISKTAYGPS